jgi:hypothetical protein
MGKKYGLIGTIMSISILLALMILGPNAVATTPVDGGTLLSQVQSPGCIVVAVASAVNDHDEEYNGNQVEVTVYWTLDKQCTLPGFHGFYLNVTNSNTGDWEDDYDYLGSSAGPDYQTGTLTAGVDGAVPDDIIIYIYVNVTYSGRFAEDNDTAIITLSY